MIQSLIALAALFLASFLAEAAPQVSVRAQVEVADVRIGADADTARIETHLKRVVAADPTFVPAHLALARLLIRSERWTEAVSELEKAVSVDPEVAEAYYHLGRVYSRLKRADDARAAVATFERLSASQKEQEHTELQQVVRRLADVRF